MTRQQHEVSVVPCQAQISQASHFRGRDTLTQCQRRPSRVFCQALGGAPHGKDGDVLRPPSGRVGCSADPMTSKRIRVGRSGPRRSGAHAETPGLSEPAPPRRPTGGERAGYFPKILARNIPHPSRLPGLHRVHHRVHLVSSCPDSAAPHAGAQRRDWISAVRSSKLLRPHPAPADLAVDTLNHYLLIACEGWTGLRPPGASFGLVPSVSRCREPCESSVDQMRWDVNVPRVQRTA